MIVNQAYCQELLQMIRVAVTSIDDLKGGVRILGAPDWEQPELNGYVDVLKNHMDYLKDLADEFKDRLDELKD